MIIDALRERHPTFGFATYALVAGGEITVEVHTPDVFSAAGNTEYEAWSRLFDLSFLNDETIGDTANDEDVFA
jgi:hypothetical protein